MKLTFLHGVYYYLIRILEGKLILNDLNWSPISFNFDFVNNVLPIMFHSDFICIWYDKNTTDSELNSLDLVQFHYTYCVIYSEIATIEITAKECYNNILITSHIPKNIFKDRVPTSSHSFLVLYLASDIITLNTDSDVFGLAKTVLLQSSNIFHLSSPYFPLRVFRPVKFLPPAKQEVPKDLKGRHLTVATFNCSLFSILHEPISSDSDVFGLAKTVLLQSSNIFHLSSPYFPLRVFRPVKFLPPAKQEVPKDLKGRHLTVATFNCSLFSILHEPISSGNPDGIEMQMMLELSRILNFTPKFFDLTKNKWGDILPNGTWRGGIMGALQSGEAELGFCNIWNVVGYVGTVDFGPSWNVVSFTYMVPRPFMVHGFWFIVVQLFQKSVWIMIVTLFVLVSFLCWKYKEHSNGGAFSDAALSVLTMFGILTAVSLYIPSKVKFVRHIIISWSIFCFFISTLFCNTIITRLMIPHISSIVDSVDDIVNTNLIVCYPCYGSNKYPSESKEKDNDIEKEDWKVKMQKLFQDVPSNESTAALKSERFVFPVQRLESEYVFVNVEGLDISNLERYRVMSETLDNYHVSIAFSRKSAILDLCQIYLHRFMEVGLNSYWMKTVILNHGSKQVKYLLSNSRIETFETYKPLTVDNNIAAFRIIIAGWCLSILVFLIELLIRQKLINNSQQL